MAAPPVAGVVKEGRGASLGFTWLAKEAKPPGAEKWDLVGDDMHILSVGLAPGEVVSTEPGSMMFMGPDVTADVDCGGCFERCVGGEACGILKYTNSGSANSYVGLTPAHPADIIALDMQKYDLIKCKSGAYMSSVGDAHPSCETDCNPTTCCFAGFGCVRQTISGAGTAFIEASGTIERKELRAGETFVIDSNSLVAWHGATLGVRPAGSARPPAPKLARKPPRPPPRFRFARAPSDRGLLQACACCFNGEGLCNTTLEGPGTAWVQSMPWAAYKAQMGVIIQEEKNNAIAGGQPPAAEMHRD